MSTPVRLFDALGRPMSVQDGLVLSPVSSGLLSAGADENSVARLGVVESKFNAEVSIDAPAYGARFSPNNAAFTADAPMYTRNGYGEIATAAITNVKIVSSTSVMGMFFAASAATSTFVIASSSANDAAAGTGIRTIAIVYIGRDGMRYRTTATMNGVSNVTVNLAIPATGVEQVYATSTGAGGTAAGTITVRNTAAGTIMGQIGTGNTQVLTTEQLVQTNRTIYICGIRASARVTACVMNLIYYSYDYTTGSVVGAQQSITNYFRVAVTNVAYIPFNPPISFKVPPGYVGRIWLTVTPDAITASNYYASMDTFEATS